MQELLYRFDDVCPQGDVVPTVGGGAAVVFNDVEIHKQREPGTRKRRSSCPQPTDFDGEWTDPEERCAIAIEGHRRKYVYFIMLTYISIYKFLLTN